MTSLADDLGVWTDWDVAAFYVGKHLGLFPGWTFSTDAKHVFWTDNDLGNGLRNTLLALVTSGVLERRDETDEQFRWLSNQYAETRHPD